MNFIMLIKKKCGLQEVIAVTSQYLWAKTEPFQSVYTHGATVGIVSQTIYRTILAPGNRELLECALLQDSSQMIAFLGYWASLHDIGKIDYLFQCKDVRMKARLDADGLQDGQSWNEPVRHEKTSVIVLKRIWKEAGIDLRTRNRFAGLIGAHHQGKSGEGHKRQSAQWCAFQDEFERAMRRQFLDGELPTLHFNENQEGSISSLLLGILILADWIASGETFFDAEQLLSESNYTEHLREQAEHFFDENGFSPAKVAWGDTFCNIWPNIPEAGRRPLQSEMEHLFRQTEQRIRMILVEAPMGEGKTEAGYVCRPANAKAMEEKRFLHCPSNLRHFEPDGQTDARYDGSAWA